MVSDLTFRKKRDHPKKPTLIMRKVDQGSDMGLVETEADAEVETEDKNATMLSRIYFRHISRLSAALSLISRTPARFVIGCKGSHCRFYG